MEQNTISESALLALMNSTPVVDGERIDQLDDPVSAAELAKPYSRDTPSPLQIAHLRDARDTIQAVTRSEAAASDLYRFLDKVESHPTIADGMIHWEIEAPASALPAARLVLAWNEVVEKMPGRLRPCANPECTKFLIDHSKPNTARWCSMATCGNRMKARRYQARRSPNS
ncbi:CGNR zinc finger domain-containing protein [Microbacterium sp. W4I20]|uniref:CGNR zinc finger domain-containing protein n=1 Tax=Microbacterium sp. W4I20 TaxID=3042262 RepID=UPI0027854D0C|nr:CGNR zinc finger domain-containing protein [Microbacterium sp. W4I20]MDQ0726506.1 putative RNA-binding Zn ribbon-like protein [Microbacterium sp. W4I20]